jgi:hypothetical protein
MSTSEICAEERISESCGILDITLPNIKIMTYREQLNTRKNFFQNLLFRLLDKPY